MSKSVHRIVITLIIVLALSLRLYNLNWDDGRHLHPDERAIVMVSERISWQKVGEWSKLLTPESPLNPKFFAYGSFPLYFLKFTGYIGSYFDKTLAQYDKINLLGRVLSALFDIGTILIIYLIARKLVPHRPTLPIFAVFFYAASVLPIQLSHFYAVDTILNFLIILSLYLCILYFDTPNNKRLLLLGLVSALAFDTKFTGSLLLPVILLTIVIATFKEKIPLSINIIHLISRFLFFILIFSFCTFLFMPYAFIDFPTFVANISEQLRMAKDPYTFPFTLQYVNTLPYVYPLQQIFLWGLGPFVSLLASLGLILFGLRKSIMVYTTILRKGIRINISVPGLIIGTFCLLYFLILGQSAVKFMRYYLPLYPLLALFSAYFVDTFLERIKHILSPYFVRVSLIIIITTTLIWPLAFVNIYSKPNTRVTASRWMLSNIPADSVLAEEAWDDGLPIGIPVSYKVLELPTIEFETTPNKWDKMEKTLIQSDYLIIASNRNYRPIQRLTDCHVIPIERCYTKTSDFYKRLFTGKLNFKKVAEFAVYPQIPTLNISIDDQEADENFTVFDHPKIFIFKKE